MTADFRVDPLKHVHQRLQNLEKTLLLAEIAHHAGDEVKWRNDSDAALTEVRELLDTIRPTIMENGS